jgi:iron complex transport system substrate-binding protein
MQGWFHPERGGVNTEKRLKFLLHRRYNYISTFLICVFNILFLIFCFTGCSKPKPVPSKRVISLVPSVTEIIYALGKESLLVGNTIYCDYPEAAKQVYKVGDFSNPSIEKILRKKPSLVFATLPEQKNIVEQLKKYKIPVFISRPKSVDSLLTEITEIGKLLDANDAANTLVMALKNKLTEIASKNTNLIDLPKVYVEISATPIMTIGNLSYIDDLIRYAGAKNAFDDVDREYIVTNSEELIKRNPDVILILHPSAKKSQVKKRLGWSQIIAVKKGRIYDELNPDYFFRPGPRFIYAVEDLANIVHSVWAKKSRY